jgi:polyhydroxyalkanoate synthase subunit PhaC
VSTPASSDVPSSAGETPQAKLAWLEEEMVRETALTPKELLYARGTLRLYRYLPQTSEVYRVPVLLVMSLVSKPYIFDLTPGQSFIEYLVRSGFDVYLIDWGTPRAEHRVLRADDYIADLLPHCISQIQAQTGVNEISIIGYCLGGTFSVLYAARETRGILRNLVLIATPINAEGMEMQRKLLTPGGLDPNLMVDTLGNIPPSMIEGAFQMLRPLQKASGQMVLINNLHDPAFVKATLRIVRWGADALPFPGETFRQLANDFIKENKIVTGEFEIRGQKADLRSITVPVLHIVAEHDHVVPSAASRDLIPLVTSTDKEEWTIKGGHVSLVAGVGAVTRTWPRLVAWLAPRSM